VVSKIARSKVIIKMEIISHSHYKSKMIKKVASYAQLKASKVLLITVKIKIEVVSLISDKAIEVVSLISGRAIFSIISKMIKRQASRNTTTFKKL
jgi:hypothetical protein